MQSNNNYSVAFVGSGNVATKLAISLHNKGVNIREIYSPTIVNANKLASAIDAKAIKSIRDFSSEIDVIIISISDNALKNLHYTDFPIDSIICHTSGSVEMEIMNSCKNYGVFYPLQTFSKHTNVEISEVPFCIEANNEYSAEILNSLAKVLSNNVSNVSSSERAKMHLAAVFACNFTNAMYSIAEDLMQESGLDFNYLRPLIIETANKANKFSPKEIQTGPAIRNDDIIMNKHIAELKQNKEYSKLYSLMSDIINKTIKQK
ncbi:MAG: DUF2520 domain-containing protein [Bacteroidales bacterium]|nr:DUF2520 domain-containing protein [Bacteroidales bacterium]